MNGVLHSEQLISRSGIVVSPPRVIEDTHSLALRSAGAAFLSTTDRGTKALFSQTHAEKLWRPDGLLDLSVPQQLSLFKFFRRTFGQNLWHNVFTSLSDVACAPHR